MLALKTACTIFYFLSYRPDQKKVIPLLQLSLYLTAVFTKFTTSYYPTWHENKIMDSYIYPYAWRSLTHRGVKLPPDWRPSAANPISSLPRILTSCMTARF